MDMNATLNIGQTIGDFRVEKFVKASNENGGETYFVSGRDGKKALMKLYAVETKAHTVEVEVRRCCHNTWVLCL